MIFLTSWDDGHPLDSRVAELLDRFNLAGTFFVPLTNSEGRTVMSSSLLRDIDKRFEVGAHTRDHVYLDRICTDEAREQIDLGKRGLEELLGHTVHGFCYPGGKANRTTEGLVREAGFRYARTIENLRFDLGTNPYLMPVTLQFYPHRASVFMKNYVRYGHYFSKLPLLTRIVSGKDYFDILYRLTERCHEVDGIFHLWGHSWEIESLGLWAELENYLRMIASLKPRSVSLADAISL